MLKDLIPIVSLQYSPSLTCGWVPCSCAEETHPIKPHIVISTISAAYSYRQKNMSSSVISLKRLVLEKKTSVLVAEREGKNNINHSGSKTQPLYMRLIRYVDKQLKILFWNTFHKIFWLYLFGKQNRVDGHWQSGGWVYVRCECLSCNVRNLNKTMTKPSGCDICPKRPRSMAVSRLYSYKSVWIF